MPNKEGGKNMSKHHHHHEECCCPSMYPIGGYGAGAYGAGAVGGAGAGGFSGVKWIYALLILIVIVLQFGRRQKTCENFGVTSACDDGIATTGTGCGGLLGNNQLIDNSVLFIIVVFLLILCAGCFGGGTGAAGGAGYGGFGGGYGY